MPKYVVTKTIQTQVEATSKTDARNHVRDTNLNHWVEVKTTVQEA